jgi:F-type H+-transporting ATPase subunit beta
MLFPGFGERIRESSNLFHEIIKTGVINLEVDSKFTFIFGQINEALGARTRVTPNRFTIAEYFSDEEDQDVLLFINNISRVANLPGPIMIPAVMSIHESAS